MKWLYYRFIYRHLMRLSHRFNWHHTRTIYPEGDTLVVCDWCGIRCVTKRAAWDKALASLGEQKRSEPQHGSNDG